MIVFDLACSRHHRFEGWFASSEDFVRQKDEGLVRCPVCDDAIIERRPSARVSVSKGGVPAAGNRATPEPATEAAPAVTGLPAEIIRQLREIVKSTENVGRRFPEEARKIHYEESPARAIRGQASAEEAEALRDEGIDFSSLPDFLTKESH